MSFPQAKTKKAARPYNRYNIYFILERENLILSKGGLGKWSSPSDTSSTPKQQTTELPNGYKNLDIPPLPPRFGHLKPPAGWYISGKTSKKRVHRKTHGVASFRELAQSIAKSWKNVDSVTLAWCSAVEKVSQYGACISEIIVVPASPSICSNVHIFLFCSPQYYHDH